MTGLSASRFGIYVHFPFCLSKCPYCDFASIVAPIIPDERYTASILRELELRLGEWPELSGRQVDSIYFGGGTPSLWAPRHVSRVIESFRKHFDIGTGVEVTLEANPGASDSSRFYDYRQAGVNRLSIGVQSFHPETLRFLGREHDAKMAEDAVRSAHAAGIENVSIDLIHGVPTQSLEEVRADARRAVEQGVTHLSAYALTLEREALAEEVPLARRLRRGEFQLPQDAMVLDMEQALIDTFGSGGYGRYEISNYSKPGLHSRHNSLYWTGGEYLALGAGAVGYVHTQHTRYTNHRSANAWFDAILKSTVPESGREQLTHEDIFSERVAMGLRLTIGVDLQGLCREWKVSLSEREPLIRLLEKEGHATWRDGRLALTTKGLALHSAIAARLI